MDKARVLYTAIYPYTKFNSLSLAEVLYNFTGDNIDILKRLLDLQASYPNFYEWFYHKVLKDLNYRRNGRNILFAISKVEENEQILTRLTGIAILKNEKEEKKICTFRVFPEYQKQGIGKKLMKCCFDYLDTSKPMITMPDYMVRTFRGFAIEYKWKLCQRMPDYYKAGVTEYVYNGLLPLKIEMNEKKLLDRAKNTLLKRPGESHRWYNL